MEMLFRFEAVLNQLKANNDLRMSLPEVESFLSSKIFDLHNFMTIEMAHASKAVIANRLCEFERDLTTAQNVLASRDKAFLH